MSGPGLIGQFNFQALLLALVSSVALLAVATTVVNVLAFNVLPLNFIYRQYRQTKVSCNTRGTAHGGGDLVCVCGGGGRAVRCCWLACVDVRHSVTPKAMYHLTSLPHS